MGHGESPESGLLVLRPPLFDGCYRMVGEDFEGAVVVGGTLSCNRVIAAWLLATSIVHRREIRLQNSQESAILPQS
jgi:hypothetical protein